MSEYPPGYWIYETSGVLKPVINKYLNGVPLNPEDIATMRAYLRQWINAPAWDQNPYGGTSELDGLRDGIDSLTTEANIDTWVEKAIDAGIDPL